MFMYICVCVCVCVFWQTYMCICFGFTISPNIFVCQAVEFKYIFWLTPSNINSWWEGHFIVNFYSLTDYILKKETLPWLVWLNGLSSSLWTKGLPVWFPDRAHAWVAGQVPSRRYVRGNHTLMLLSLSISLPPSLFKNK